MPRPRVGDLVPEELARAEVVGVAGDRAPLGARWQASPCVVVWLRHFGCVGCSAEVTELAPRLAELAQAGVRTVLVGSGTPEQRDAFVERHALAGAAVEVVTDPPLASYRAAGLLRSRWATLGPRSLWQLARAMAAGHPHRETEGDGWQQGGQLAVAAGGRVVLFHASRSLGDHLPASDLVEAALRMEIAGRAVVV